MSLARWIFPLDALVHLPGILEKTYFNDEEFFKITSVAFGDGQLKIVGDFKLKRRDNDFNVYLYMGENEEIMKFELSSKLDETWSLGFDGVMEFSFCLRPNFSTMMQEHMIEYNYSPYDFIYTDFGLLLDYDSYPDRNIKNYWGWPFWASLQSSFFVGDLEGVYNVPLNVLESLYAS